MLSQRLFFMLVELVAGTEPEPVFKHESVNAVIAFDLDSAKKLIVTATRLMSSQRQAKVARDLSIDQQGDVLMELLNPDPFQRRCCMTSRWLPARPTLGGFEGGC